ncbi:3-oxoadipate enol-lactonase [soil metagenome]
MYHHLPDEINLYYEIQGKTDAETTLVFLNGLSQSTASWLGIAPAFYAKYKVVLVDLVFQGQSGKSENFRTYDNHAADIYDLLSKTCSGKVVLCGISYGSAITQHLLVNYPDFFAGGIMLSTFGHNTDLFNLIGESWINALNAGGYALMLDVMLPVVLGKSYFEKPLIPVETMKESRIARELDRDSLLKLMEATKVRGDYRNQLHKIKVPVLIVQGEEDFLIPPVIAKEVAEKIQKAEFVVIEKAGHTLNLEAIPQVIKLLKSFLIKIESASK